jgi:hypothetical protein
MMDDEALWMRTVEAALASGRGFVEALEAADGTMASYWRAQRTTRRPGLAKCDPDEALPTRHAAAGAPPRPRDPAARTAAR